MNPAHSLTNIQNFNRLLEGGSYRQRVSASDLLNLYPGKVVRTEPWSGAQAYITDMYERHALIGNPYVVEDKAPAKSEKRIQVEQAVAYMERQLNAASNWDDWCAIESRITEAWQRYYQDENPA